jgi:LacI family transcriptional regulator
MPGSPTIRSLARKLRLSHATVSEALRDVPRVNVETRKRVQQAAARAGYRLNPLLAAALSAVRRGRHQKFQGTLAVVDTAEGGRREQKIFHRELTMGARARAQELGFNVELFWVPEYDSEPHLRRLQSVLRARGISGLVLMPFPIARDISTFDFSRFAAVQLDHCLLRPRLHTITPDNYSSMMHALARLRERGYTRIGLCMDQEKDIHLNCKWSAGFHAFFRSVGRPSDGPALIASPLTRSKFIQWFERYRPQVVVGHVQTMVSWLEQADVRVPEHVGFLKLNTTERIAECTGLDLQPRQLGAIAVETVVAMLHRQEWGIPQGAQTTMLEAEWVEGPTLLDRAPTPSWGMAPK